MGAFSSGCQYAKEYLNITRVVKSDDDKDGCWWIAVISAQVSVVQRAFQAAIVVIAANLRAIPMMLSI